MIDRPNPAHLGPEDLVDYVDDKVVDEGRKREIEHHLDVCQECQGLAKKVGALSRAWDQWSGETYRELSLIHRAQKHREEEDYEAAEGTLQQALEMRREAVGEEHPSFASSLDRLAELYQAMGNYAAAEPLYQQALGIRRTNLGVAHPDVAGSLNNLAGLFLDRGDAASAEPLLDQAEALYLEDRLVASLKRAQAEEAIQEMKERLSSWIQHFHGHAAGAVRIIVGKAESATEIVLEGLKGLLPAEGRLVFEPEPELARSGRGGQDKGSETRLMVVEAPGPVEGSTTRVALDPGTRRVNVSIDSFPENQTPPLVMLVPSASHHKPEVRRLERSESPSQSKTVATQFTNIDPADYLLVIEPLRRTDLS